MVSLGGKELIPSNINIAKYKVYKYTCIQTAKWSYT